MTQWNKETVQALLDRSDTAVERALLVVYARQTEDEKASHQTTHHNAMGFTGVDAPLLTDIAQKLKHYGRLTPRQCDLVRRKIRKYWRQLLDEIEVKGNAAKPVPAALLPQPELMKLPAKTAPEVPVAVAGSW